MLGILCGLRSEAKIAQAVEGAAVACAAAVPLKARALAAGLVAQGARRLMSFGVAGALDPGMPVGALLIGERVLSDKGRWVCDRGWADELARHFPAARRGDVWGSETLIPTAAEKSALQRTSGCAIVDMESQCAAEIAAEAKLPLAVLRVVCDEATHNVPPLVMSAINEDGSTNIGKVILGLLREPRQTFDLIHVGRSMACALRALEEAAKNLEGDAL